jgi:ATP/ADP translocase
LKKISNIITIISLLFSFALVAAFIAAAIKAENYAMACVLIIIFMLLMKVQNIDYFKITKDSVEVKDDHDDKV